MMNKSLHRNVLAAVAVGTGATKTSGQQSGIVGRGVRFFVTVSAVTATGTSDSFYLCEVPFGGSPIPLVGFTAANLLATVGTFIFDFYPGGWLPNSGLAAGGNLKGVAGVQLPLTWAVQAVMGAGNAATLQVDAVLMP